jgi:hypothetical protein
VISCKRWSLWWTVWKMRYEIELPPLHFPLLPPFCVTIISSLKPFEKGRMVNLTSKRCVEYSREIVLKICRRCLWKWWVGMAWTLTSMMTRRVWRGHVSMHWKVMQRSAAALAVDAWVTVDHPTKCMNYGGNLVFMGGLV